MTADDFYRLRKGVRMKNRYLPLRSGGMVQAHLLQDLIQELLQGGMRFTVQPLKKQV